MNFLTIGRRKIGTVLTELGIMKQLRESVRDYSELERLTDIIYDNEVNKKFEVETVGRWKVSLIVFSSLIISSVFGYFIGGM
jgi:hypothetical protein